MAAGRSLWLRWCSRRWFIRSCSSLLACLPRGLDGEGLVVSSFFFFWVEEEEEEVVVVVGVVVVLKARVRAAADQQEG